VEPRPSLTTRLVARLIGTAVGPLFGIASYVRRRRAVHPYGDAYAVTITIDESLSSLAGTAFGNTVRLGGIVRLSHGLGRSAGKADVRGFALRALGPDGAKKQDIVMMSTFTRGVRQMMSLPTSYTTRYSSVVPLTGPQGPLVFTCLPLESGAADQFFDRGSATGFRFELQAGVPHGTPYRFAEIELGQPLSADEAERLRFDPCNAELGLVPIDTINLIRKIVYPMSQIGRSVWYPSRPAPPTTRIPSDPAQDHASAASAARPGSR